MNLGEYMREARLQAGGLSADWVCENVRKNGTLPVGDPPKLTFRDLLAIERGERPAGARVLVHWTAAMRRLGADVDAAWLMRSVESPGVAESPAGAR